MLQPLDVSLNKPFKDKLRQQWSEWMVGGKKSYTKGGNMRAPSLDVLCNFIIKAWSEIKVETVIKSFKKCGISNAMDGTEDDCLWNEGEEAAEAEVDDAALSDTEFDPYDDALCNVSNDVIDELLQSDDDSQNDFQGF